MDDLFEREQRILDSFRAALTASDGQDWRELFGQATAAYADLLQATVKLTRTADRQHAWLVGNHSKLLTANQALEQASSVDPLTGLYNRYKMERLMQAVVDEPADARGPCALMLIDVDHFKTINDTYGHNTGDEVLARFADVLRTRLRSSDCGGRWGGDEFIALLPNTDGAQAALVAEAVRAAVEQAGFPVAGVTASFGVAALAEGMDRTAWVEAADRGLYAAKRDGRNRVGADR